MLNEKEKLDCIQCDKLIPGYLDDTLTPAQMSGFLAHIRGCKRCKEELTVSYLLEEGLNRLETGAAFDLNNELEKSLEQNNREIRLRYVRAVMSFTLCAVIIAIAFYYILMLILNS